MKETIYTIPVTEAFEKKCGCPLCALYDMLEERELQAITGASMMEPAVRIRTNNEGFCAKHYGKMSLMKAKLPMALTLQSRVAALHSLLSKEAPSKKGADKPLQLLKTQTESCYVCNRVESFLEQMCATVAYLWKKEPEFQALFLAQDYFCLPHFRLLLEYAPKGFLLGAGLQEFVAALYQKELAYLGTLEEDLAWFSKKFDYRFQEADWKNSKDSVERTIAFLTGRA